MHVDRRQCSLLAAENSHKELADDTPLIDDILRAFWNESDAQTYSLDDQSPLTTQLRL